MKEFFCKKNLIVLALGAVALSVSATITHFIEPYVASWITGIVYAVLVLAYLVMILGLVIKKEYLYKSMTFVYVTAIVLLLVFGSIFWSGIYLEFFNENGEIEASKIADVIASQKASVPIYILLAFLQVTFVPISSSIVTMVGVILFGPGYGFLFSLIGQFLGSLLAFYLGRWFGERFVVWVIGKEAFQKYREIIKGRDKIMLSFMFLLPLFPDDMLCLLAGLTTFTGLTFSVMVLITRSIAIAYTTAGVQILDVISGLGVWAYVLYALLVIVIIAIMVLIWKRGDKLEYKAITFIDKILPKKYRKIFVSDKALGVFENQPSENNINTSESAKTDENANYETDEHDCNLQENIKKPEQETINVDDSQTSSDFNDENKAKKDE